MLIMFLDTVKSDTTNCSDQEKYLNDSSDENKTKSLDKEEIECLDKDKIECLDEDKTECPYKYKTECLNKKKTPIPASVTPSHSALTLLPSRADARPTPL